MTTSEQSDPYQNLPNSFLRERVLHLITHSDCAIPSIRPLEPASPTIFEDETDELALPEPLRPLEESSVSKGKSPLEDDVFLDSGHTEHTEGDRVSEYATFDGESQVRKVEPSAVEEQGNKEQWRVGKTPGHQGSHARIPRKTSSSESLSPLTATIGEKRSLSQVS